MTDPTPTPDTAADPLAHLPLIERIAARAAEISERAGQMAARSVAGTAAPLVPDEAWQAVEDLYTAHGVDFGDFERTAISVAFSAALAARPSAGSGTAALTDPPAHLTPTVTDRGHTHRQTPDGRPQQETQT